MRGPQHYLPLCAHRGHTGRITYHWRHHHYWPRCEYSSSSSSVTQQSVCYSLHMCTECNMAAAVRVHLQIAVGECYRVRFRGVSSKAFIRNLYVSCLYKELGCFLFGCCVGQSLTNMAKLSVGRLRPHFLSVCGVTYASLNCTPGTYVTTVSCHQPDHRLEEEARCVCVCVHFSYELYFCCVSFLIL